MLKPHLSHAPPPPLADLLEFLEEREAQLGIKPDPDIHRWVPGRWGGRIRPIRQPALCRPHCLHRWVAACHAAACAPAPLHLAAPAALAVSHAAASWPR